MGVICSLLLYLILLAYTYQKLDILIGRKDVDFLSVTKENYIDVSETFGAEQGLNFAVAVLNSFSSAEHDLDPTYGRIEFKQNQGYQVDGGFELNQVEIKSHKCTREELGLSEGVNRFW